MLKLAATMRPASGSIRMPPRLGLRTVAVRRGEMASDLTATGTIDFNQRDVAIVQTRAAGFVQRVYAARPVM
jgi:Cu(I)/Ag(I) efflux system membrane fusion protein